MLLSSILGMVMMSSARDLDQRVRRPRVPVDPRVHDGRVAQARSQEQRGRRQVLPARRVRQRGDAVRHEPAVRRDRQHQARPTIGELVTGKGKLGGIEVMGIVFVIVGFAFKVSAVPFHTWAPDTYEGAPTPVTAFLSVASKAAGFVALILMVYLAFPQATDVYRPFIWVLSALTMTVGNVVALKPDQHRPPARVLQHQPGRVHPDAARRRRLDPFGRGVAARHRRLPDHLRGDQPRCVRRRHRGQPQDPQRRDLAASAACSATRRA